MSEHQSPSISDIHIESEIAPLEAVVVHRPGPEIEQMTPDRAGELLYNDIVPMSTVAPEHDAFVAVLRHRATVYEVSDLLSFALTSAEIRARFVAELSRGVPKRRDELSLLSPAELSRVAVCGLRKRSSSLHEYLQPRAWDIPPLPNLYFMRDAAFVVGNHLMVSRMAHPVRDGEASINRAIFGNAAVQMTDIGMTGVDCEQRRGVQRSLRIEGGDIHVLSGDVLVVGVSDRTSAEGVDRLASALVAERSTPLTLVVCLLPSKRSCIHLDMIFSRIDSDCALIHAPLVSGSEAVTTVCAEYFPNGDTRFSDGGSLLSCLENLGMPHEPVVCGGRDPLHQSREQWLSGTNALVIDPGTILVYDCNPYTIEALCAAGFEITTSADYVNGAVDETVRRGRRAILIPGSELARGGGGPRCMSLPLRRRTAEAGVT